MASKSITSVQNPRIKEAVRLRTGRHRAKRGRFLIDGARELLRALSGGVRLIELFVCVPLCTSPRSQEVLARLNAIGTDAWHVPEEVFDKLAFGRRHDGVLAVAETPHRGLEALRPAGDGLIAIVVGLEKPGNLGAIVRSADAAGVAAVIVADGGTDLYNPNCIRASLGTLFTLPVCTAASGDVLAWLRGGGLRIFAARPDAKLRYTDAELGHRAVVVLGSEAGGLPDVWRAPDITPIKLPMLGAADSLNVSATAAVLFYESLRQRRPVEA